MANSTSANNGRGMAVRCHKEGGDERKSVTGSGKPLFPQVSSRSKGEITAAGPGSRWRSRSLGNEEPPAGIDAATRDCNTYQPGPARLRQGWQPTSQQRVEKSFIFRLALRVPCSCVSSALPPVGVFADHRLVPDASSCLSLAFHHHPGLQRVGPSAAQSRPGGSLLRGPCSTPYHRRRQWVGNPHHGREKPR